MRHPGGWSLKATPAVVTISTGRAVSHTILGTISATFVVSMKLGNPPEEWSKSILATAKEKCQLRRNLPPKVPSMDIT